MTCVDLGSPRLSFGLGLPCTLSLGPCDVASRYEFGVSCSTFFCTNLTPPGPEFHPPVGGVELWIRRGLRVMQDTPNSYLEAERRSSSPRLAWEEVFAPSATRLHSLSIGSRTTFPGPSLWFFPSGGRLRGKVWLARALSAPRAPCVGLFSIGSRTTFANREIFRLGLLSRYCVNTNVLKCYFGLY